MVNKTITEMKKILMYFAIGVMTMACQQNLTDFQPEGDEVFYAEIDNNDQYRTILDENYNVLWTEGDQISIFKKSAVNSKYEVSSAAVGKTSGRFTNVSTGNDDFTAGGELDQNVAFYPYQDQLSVLKVNNTAPTTRFEIQGVVLPEVQEYVPNSFAPGAFPMAAVSMNNELTFKNICGGVKLQLKGTQKVTSIKLTGKNNEKLSGLAVVTAYADDKTPAITMTSESKKTVSLNCGAGVQLVDKTATEFILSLPPVLFEKGFTVVVSTADDKNYTVETDKANTVLRSSLLIMPVFTLGDVPGDDTDDELVVPVHSVSLNPYFNNLFEGTTLQFEVSVSPRDATDKEVTWSSDDSSVASVNQAGLVTAISPGKAKISATVGGVSGTAYLTVLKYDPIDYIDEYGVNHGKGTVIGAVIWAPVNCGYHETDFKYGKLYQWGRKYGQGYDGPFFNYDGSPSGTYSDAVVPSIEEGMVSELSGNHKSKANVFYTWVKEEEYNNWVFPQIDTLWGGNKHKENPRKTVYDPCPDGWRVASSEEATKLIKNHSPSMTYSSGQAGLWFSGESAYSSEVPQIFLPAAGELYKDGTAEYRGYMGQYWTCTSYNAPRSYRIGFNSGVASIDSEFRAEGMSVRCVQDNAQ